MTCGSPLDPALVQFLQSAASTPVGVIWGRTHDELRRITLARSAASALNGPTNQPRIDIASGADRSVDTIAGVKALGAKATPAATRDALSAGAGVLALHAHGSGPRINIRAGMPLCAVSQNLRDSLTRDLAPACVTTGYCFAVQAQVAEAVKQQLIVDPYLLRTRILILGSCQALYVGSPELAQRWSYFPHLNGNWKIGAVLATPDLVINMAISDDLTSPIAAGMGVGNALRDYNTSPTALELGQRFLLFGDPRTRAAPRKSAPFVARPTASRQQSVRRASPAQPVYRESTERHLEVLRHISHTVRSDTRDTGRRTSARAARALSQYEEAQPSSSSMQTALWNAILEHLGTLKGRTYDGWFSHSSRVKMRDNCHPCPSCGWPALLYHCALPSEDVRVLVNCGRCGNVLDVPDGSPLHIDVESTTLRLSGLSSDSPWAAATYLVPEVASRAQVHYWHRPSRVFDLPSLDCLPGPVAIRTVVISPTTISCFVAGGGR